MKMLSGAILLSVEVRGHYRHSKQSGPWGSADFRRPTSARLVLNQGTHHSSMSNLEAQRFRVWTWRGRRTLRSVTRQHVTLDTS
jgi:hypothetical protein